MESADGLKNGDYQFPIQFKMPTNIPGSFYYSGLWEGASISYNIYCEIFSDDELVGRAKNYLFVL